MRASGIIISWCLHFEDDVVGSVMPRLGGEDSADKTYRTVKRNMSSGCLFVQGKRNWGDAVW